MARTSKTKVSGSGRNMENATAARARQSQDAKDARDAADRRTAQVRQDMSRGVSAAAGMMHQDQQRQKSEEFRAGEAEKQRQFQGQQAAAGRAQQESQFQRGQELRAAEQGLVPNPQQGAAGQPSPQGDPAQQQGQADPELQRRQQELQAEMERGEKQASVGSEFDGSRWIPGPERQQEMGIKQMRAETERSRIEVMRQNTIDRAARAAARGDKADYDAQRQSYAGQMKSTIKLADKVMGNKIGQITPSEKGLIAELAARNPDPELQAEIEKGIYGPRTAQLLRGKAFVDSLPFVALKGDFPDGDLIDYSHPKYQEFVGTYVPEAKNYFQQRQAIAPIAGVESFLDAQRLVRQAAAIAMMKSEAMGRERAQAESMGAGPSPEQPPMPPMSMNPNAPAPPPEEEQRRRLEGRLTPDEQFQRGGAAPGATIPDVGGHGQSWGNVR